MRGCVKISVSGRSVTGDLGSAEQSTEYNMNPDSRSHRNGVVIAGKHWVAALTALASYTALGESELRSLPEDSRNQ